MENSIPNSNRVLDLKVIFLTLSVISNNCRLLIQSNCNRIPVWTLCAVDSRGRVIQLNLILLLVLLLISGGTLLANSTQLYHTTV